MRRSEGRKSAKWGAGREANVEMRTLILSFFSDFHHLFFLFFWDAQHVNVNWKERMRKRTRRAKTKLGIWLKVLRSGEAEKETEKKALITLAFRPEVLLIFQQGKAAADSGRQGPAPLRPGGVNLLAADVEAEGGDTAEVDDEEPAPEEGGGGGGGTGLESGGGR